MVPSTKVLLTNFGNFKLRQNHTVSITESTQQLASYAKTNMRAKLKINSQPDVTASRKNWKTYDFSFKCDKAALLKHFYKQHQSFLLNKHDIAECFFFVVGLFVEQPLAMNLDVCENKWASFIRATISIKKMICPSVI